MDNIVKIDTTSSLNIGAGLVIRPEWDIFDSTYAWWDASDSSTVTIETGITQLDDKSGNGYHFKQSAASEQPEYVLNAQNGLNKISFNGVTKMHTDNIANVDSRVQSSCLVIAFKPAGVDSSFDSIISWNGGGTDYQIDSNNAGEWRGQVRSSSSLTIGTVNTLWENRILSLVTNLTEWEIYKNGTLKDTNTVGTLDVTDIIVGLAINRGNSQPLASDFYEAMILPRRYRREAEGYLAHKWGIEDLLPINHPYKDYIPF